MPSPLKEGDYSRMRQNREQGIQPRRGCRYVYLIFQGLKTLGYSYLALIRAIPHFHNFQNKQINPFKPITPITPFQTHHTFATFVIKKMN